jgi:hypothetical protein
MLKIGLTICNLNTINSRIFNNGLYQNIIFLYDYLKKNTNYDVYLISGSSNKDYSCINFSDIEKLLTFDFIIQIGLIISDEILIKIKDKVKLIRLYLGNDYINDIFNILSNNSEDVSFSNLKLFNEIWISPHFEYSIDYYKYTNNTDNVLVSPFIWSPKFIPNELKNTNMDILNVAVFEPNLNQGKSCFIPIIICDRASEYINKALIFNSRHLAKERQSFLNYCKLSNMFNEGRLTCEDRHKFIDIMDKYCNIVVSYQENWDLNYLYLECFYLGIPLIHNSEMLKDWGYYYPKCDVSIAVNHIKNLKYYGFNRKNYIDRHKLLLHKYSMKNTANIKFFEDRLSIENKKIEIKCNRIENESNENVLREKENVLQENESNENVLQENESNENVLQENANLE